MDPPGVMFHAIYERGFGYFGGGGGGVKRGGNFDDGGPLWTNGQHGYKIDGLIILYYNCAGVEWSSDPPTNRRFFELALQKWKGGSPPR